MSPCLTYQQTDDATNELKQTFEPPKTLAKCESNLKEELKLELIDIECTAMRVNDISAQCARELDIYRAHFIEDGFKQANRNIQLLSNLNYKFNQAVKLFFEKCREKHMRCEEGRCLLCLNIFESCELFLKKFNSFETLDFTKDNVFLNDSPGTSANPETTRPHHNAIETLNKWNNEKDEIRRPSKNTKYVKDYSIVDEKNYEYLKKTIERLEFNLNTYRTEAEIYIKRLDDGRTSRLCFYDSEDELKDSFLFEDVAGNLEKALGFPLIKFDQWYAIDEDNGPQKL